MAVVQNLQIFTRQNVEDKDRARLICILKLHHIPTYLAKVHWVAFFGLKDNGMPITT